MANKYPYISGAGNLFKAIQQFRSSLPEKIDADTLKKLGIAPNSESYIINILQFLNVISEEGAVSAEARTTFTQHDDAAFGKKLSEMIKKAYSDLFSLHGDKAWELDKSALITYFRNSDQTSAIVGERQATTFLALAAFAGHGEVPSVRSPAIHKEITAGTNLKQKTAKKLKVPLTRPAPEVPGNRSKELGLTVRIEINLPVAEDQAIYDRIFKSIKENLLND